MLRYVEIGAVHKCANLVGLSMALLQNEHLVAKLGFDTAENETRQTSLYDQGLILDYFCPWQVGAVPRRAP